MVAMPWDSLRGGPRRRGQRRQKGASHAPRRRQKTTRGQDATVSRTSTSRRDGILRVGQACRRAARAGAFDAMAKERVLLTEATAAWRTSRHPRWAAIAAAAARAELAKVRDWVDEGPGETGEGESARVRPRSACTRRLVLRAGARHSRRARAEPLDEPIAFWAAVLVGVLFAVFSARKAARLNPLAALRFE